MVWSELCKSWEVDIKESEVRLKEGIDVTWVCSNSDKQLGQAIHTLFRPQTQLLHHPSHPLPPYRNPICPQHGERPEGQQK